MIKLSDIYDELIVEGASPIIYHFTRIDRLKNMLDTNSFFLTPGTAKSEKTRDRTYFMSFTRSKSTKLGYGTKFRHIGSVRIKVNGQKLSNNHKVFPVDYWQYPKTAEFMRQGIGDEMEDRLVSNNNTVNDANRYIISVDVLVDEKGVDENIINNANKLGVKLNFYNNLKSFDEGNINNTIQPNTNSETPKKHRDFVELSIVLGTLTYKEPKIYEYIIDKLKNEFHNEGLISNIKKHHEKLDYYLSDDDYHLRDLTNSLDAEIHNNKTKFDKLSRFSIYEFLKDYKKNNVNSLKDYLLHKLYIGKKTHKQYNIEFNSKIKSVIEDSFKSETTQSFTVYDVEGNYVENIFEEDPIKNYLIGKINEIYRYTSNYILSNTDMYKHSYLLSSSELKKTINFDENDSQLQSLLNKYQDVRANEIIRPILVVIWNVDEIAYSEANKIKEEFNAQFRNP